MTYETTEDYQLHVLDRINVMRSKEKKTAGCHNYLNSLVDESCRRAMVEWFFIVVDSYDLSRETVGIAMSISDRYLSSGKGKSAEALRNKERFQLATITSFYMAVKIFEPAQLGIRTIAKLCRGFYKDCDIFAMEQDILFSLEWRVCSSATTPVEYVRQFLELLPEWTDVSGVILENAMKHMDCVTRDIYFSTCRTSTLGAACLAAALNDTHGVSSFEKGIIWRQLNRKLLGFDLECKETKEVERLLLATSTHIEPKRPSRASLPRSSVSSATEQLSSPVSVVQ